jgi:hypothetical protein
MANKNVLRVPAVLAAVTLLSAYGAHAGPVRYDDGSETGNSGVWDPQQADVDSFGDQLDLGFNFDFFGATATRVQVNSSGQLELLSGTTILGSITIADSAATSAIYGRAAGAVDPLPALNGDAVTDGFRVQWNFANGLQAQLALFALGSGGSIIEFNYLSDLDGLDLSSGATSLGVIDPLVGTGFNLLDYLTSSQPSCLTTFGRGVLGADDDAPIDNCTSYFVDNALSSVALPAPFNTTNGGPAGSDPLADYRYLLRYTATTTPPSPVPEPATLTLLTLGLGALAARRRRRD